MAQNFIECERDQELLLPPSMREWLPEDHLAWYVADAVGELDLAAFYGAYREDGWGRAAFEPQMMVALLLYAYAVGERSSRGIERRFREDVAFRVLATNQIPDHATIARFRARHEQALADTFTQVLALCTKAGLVSVGVVALDGSLISANASPAATRTYPEIRAEVERMLEEAAATDEREDAELGEARGDELPEGLGPLPPRAPASLPRRARGRSRCRAALPRGAPGPPRGLGGRAWAQAGRPQAAPPAEDALQKAKINTTDPDSRPLQHGSASVQGYNAQVLAAEGQVILAADLTQSPVESTELEPMVAKAGEELQAAGVEEPIDTLLADGGYWSAPQIVAIRDQGTEVIIPTRNARRTAPRKLAAKQGPEAERIERILATPAGQALYRRRQQIVEPVFANTKFIRGATRFQRRGLAACLAEWKLLAATHNLLKLWRAGLARPLPA
ncbi:MAG TPA: transposase [Solirubrobacterales bacterium]|nr:transposase [Solirubrobacterales bacterium]